jgi:hypothetical protein
VKINSYWRDVMVSFFKIFITVVIVYLLGRAGYLNKTDNIKVVMEGHMDSKDVVIDIDNSVAYLVNRPKDSPKVVVRIYDVAKVDLAIMKWGTKKTDEKGREYIEATWGE